MKITPFLAFAFLLASAFSVRADDAPLTFEQHVRPILKAHCFDCHGDKAKPKGGLDLRLVRSMANGGDTGPAFKAGNVDGSLLLKRIVDGDMPPGKKKLRPDEIDVIRRWLKAGAKTARPEPEKLDQGFVISPEEEAFWSFQPIARPTPPTVKNAKLVRSPIDAFLLQKLEKEGMSYTTEADRRTLIRRATIDLLGLPPTVAEVEAFVSDKAPDAYEKVLDRLLASPHYGERWGRHWLDVAGYADTEGFTGEDPARKSSWRYRDYVIRALNNDKPFDVFIREQLAGDELVKPPYDKIAVEDYDKLIATGFLRQAPDGSASKEVDLPVAINQTIADTIQIATTTLLGLTVHCAQCHNHRYDPISQEDYYRVRAIFEPALDWKEWRKPIAREVPYFDAESRARIAENAEKAAKIDAERVLLEKKVLGDHLEKLLGKVPADDRDLVREAFAKPPLKRLPKEVLILRKYPEVGTLTLLTLAKADPKSLAKAEELKLSAAKIRNAKVSTESIRVLNEVPGKVPTTFLFDRGDHDAPKQAIAPGTPSVFARHKLGAIAERDPKLPTTGRRLAFAEWVTHADNPLTTRVLVNRFWMHHFGRGLVNTPSDFGALGDRPTHPELLDWLAREFQARGWKLKEFHKLVMTTTAYRQASTRPAEQRQRDPDNKLLGQMSIRRLEAETLRDAMLSVGGKLNAKTFGQPVPLRYDDAGQVILGVNTDDGAGRPTGKFVPLNGEEFRRSIYVTVHRTKPLGLLETFDQAMLNPNCECRTHTTVTPQSLMLMNSQTVQEYAGFFAQRLKSEAGTDPRQQATLAWRHAFGLEPDAKMLDGAVRFLDEQAKQFRQLKTLPAGADVPTLALTNFCQALLSSNQFLYVD